MSPPKTEGRVIHPAPKKLATTSHHLSLAGRQPQQLRLAEPDVGSQRPAGKVYDAGDMALVLDRLHRRVHWWLRTWEGRHQLAFIQARDAA